jgi:hypothetical protein
MSTVARTLTIPSRPPGDPNKYNSETIKQQLMLLADERIGEFVFVSNYCQIFSNDESGWIPFRLWNVMEVPDEYDNQVDLLQKMKDHKRLIVAKSRQQGASWLTLCHFLYGILFHPIKTVLLLSRGQLESIELMRRIRNVYSRLPYWLKVKDEPTASKTYWELSNGSKVMSLSTSSGDSFVASECAIDEADLVWQAGGGGLQEVLLKVTPTLGAKGQLILVSKMDKSRPNSTFKNLFRGAMRNENGFAYSFIPWNAHPERDEAWYEARKQEALSANNNLDPLLENFPATINEMLSPKSTDKRLPYDWIAQCYQEERPLTSVQQKELTEPEWYDKNKEAFTIPHIEFFRMPKPGTKYCVACDCAEGITSSDDSALHVINVDTLEECVRVGVKAEPSTLAWYAHVLSKLYYNAPVMPERNQHGHAFILWMRDNASDTKILSSPADKRAGWITNTATKSLGYSKLAEALRDQKTIIHSAETFKQLSNVSESTLSAPKGSKDDNAITFMIAVATVSLVLKTNFHFSFI